MMRACDIPHTEFVAQLSRHLASVPASRVDNVRRGAVAIVIRLVPAAGGAALPSFAVQGDRAALVQAVEALLANPGMDGAQAQILFIQRAMYPGDPWSGHIGFPGGKKEPQDASDRATAERETREELGLDLGGDAFVHLGALDDAQAYFLCRGVVMAASPHVYLQVCHSTPEIALSAEVASAHWVGLAQILHQVDHPAAPFCANYRCIQRDMAAQVYPAYAASRPLWFRIHAWLLGTTSYTMLPLQFTPRDSVVRTPATASKSQFASDSELYLWGLSLGMVCSLVDLGLPVAPSSLAPGYVSVASPWPQLDRYRWADVNLVTNALHRLMWGPRCRKPWRIPMRRTPLGCTVGPARDYFLSYYAVLRIAFPLSCLAKLSLLCVLGRGVVRLLSRLVCA
ncbi:hypothetical protein H4R19_001332 [Coemansia spiralis]|nr:hypothetical protein H4R19_001332 [Coemansia spiralis]